MISKTVSNWLQRIGQTEAFLHPKLSEMSDQELILDRNVVVDRIAQAIRSGEHLICFGDYDCDGMGAACILTDAIRQMGGRITPMLASRFDGGYGFSSEAATKVLASGAALLITCDCGSSDHDRLNLLRNKGIDCLVLDHHLVPDKPLPANGFLNPHRPECRSTYKWMASAGLAVSVVVGLRKKLGLSEFKVNQFFDICAISTVADVAPLTGDNRALVRAGLASISKAERPGIRALLELNKIEPGVPWTGRDIGFKLAPALNAPGRLGSPDIIVDLLLEKDLKKAREIAVQVKDLWDKRRIITDELTEDATKMVISNNWSLSPALVLGKEDWGHGIVGIIAARLVDKFNVPVCVLGHEGRGSLRGPVGSRLYDALVYCKDTLLKYGGHQAAAGCQIDFANLETFRQKFAEFFTQNPPSLEQTDQFSVLLPLDPQDDLMRVADDLMLLEPCGQGNPRPVIEVFGSVKNYKFVKDNHVKLDISLANDKPLPAFSLNTNSSNNLLAIDKPLIFRGDLRKNTWKGRTKVEMFIHSIIER